MTASQKEASFPAQSAGAMHAWPAPVGGRRQNGGVAIVAQAYPPSQSACAVQPLVQ
jgi:hypothetical protein